MKEGEAEFYMLELFQDFPTTVGGLWKNIAAVFRLIFLSNYPNAGDPNN